MKAIQQTYTPAPKDLVWGYKAVKQVLGNQKYILILLSFALFFFGVFIFIPIATTPGNTLAFQLSIFRPQDYFLMVFLALLVGLNFSMNIYVRRQQRRLVDVSRFAAGGATAGLGGVFAAIVGTASGYFSLLYRAKNKPR